jgi:hypothetical protein
MLREAATACHVRVMGITCEECRGRRATKLSPTGRNLCDQCFARLTGLAAAAGTLVAGGSNQAAVGNAIASAGYSGATEGEAQHRAEQRRKLAAADGFWQRLKIRIIG